MADPNCGLCAVVGTDHDLVVYEDEISLALLSQNPATKGHIILFPKKHHPILEQVPDDEISHLFVVANKLSMIVFEKLGCKGTNLLINNGIAAGQKQAHLMINIVPRYEDDGLDLQWEPKKLGVEEMSSVEMMLTKDEPGKEGVKQGPETIKEDSLLSESVQRIP